MKQTEIILALETGIGGGSLSIFRDGEQIDFWCGKQGVSKSEDLLPAISEILARNWLAKEALSEIVVSDFPGSVTGLRVGLAIAYGLKSALGLEVTKISALEALLSNVPHGQTVYAAVPAGKMRIVWARGTGADVSPSAAAGNYAEFEKLLEVEGPSECLVHQTVFENLSRTNKEKVFNYGLNTAYYLAEFYINKRSANPISSANTERS